MKLTIRDQMGVNIAEGDMTWTIDPQLNAEYIGAFQEYDLPLHDAHATFLGTLEIRP